MTPEERMSEDDVQEELRLLGVTLKSRQAPPHIEQALRQAFRRRDNRRWRVLGPLAAAAAILIAVLNFLPGPPTEHSPQIASAPEIASAYMPVGFTRPLYPGEFVQVVRISVPRIEMARFGLPVFEGRASARVQADVVLGEDGIARAIRFVE